MRSLYSESVDTQFNFENQVTKLNYAKAKFLLSLLLAAIYWPIIMLFFSSDVPDGDF
jgi:hypothetical protein